MQSNIESVRNWLRSCTEIENDVAFRIDTIDNTALNYAIYQAPSTQQFKRDIIGNLYLADEQVLNFSFGLNLPFGADIRQNADNARLIQSLMDWITKQNLIKNFPELEEGKVQYIVPVMAYIADAVTNTARYEITIQMRYRRKR